VVFHVKGFLKAKSLSRRHYSRIKKAVHLKDEPPQAIKRRENGKFWLMLLSIIPEQGLSRRKCYIVVI